MAEWDNEIADLKTDVKYNKEEIVITQKQVRDINTNPTKGIGGIKGLFIV